MVQKEYKCQSCEETFESEAEWRLHHRTKHEQLRCEVCGHTFRSESELRTHRWVAHPEDIPVR